MEPLMGDGARMFGARVRRFLLTRNGWWSIAFAVFIPLMVAFRIGLYWSTQFGETGVLLFGLPALFAIYLLSVIADRLWR